VRRAYEGGFELIAKQFLRACLVRVRVRMVLYALFYEKDIPN
jgi:hypothetical protein